MRLGGLVQLGSIFSMSQRIGRKFGSPLNGNGVPRG
jgi:hypothetical protein